MRKALFLVVILLCLVGITYACAEGYCGDFVTWELSDTGVLTLSGSGHTYCYESKQAPWYAQRNQIKEIVIEN